ncbi:hypothetical protein OAS67_00720 [Alphaproteobacteria bacterium]|nr:hypothetical protein [Alphaproteobacteria bacterium]
MEGLISECIADEEMNLLLDFAVKGAQRLPLVGSVFHGLAKDNTIF